MLMLDKLERRLMLGYVVVFICVLSVFSAGVFTYFRQTLDFQLHEVLSKLADSVIASIDFDDAVVSERGIPDVIVSALPTPSAEMLDELRLQWFGADGKLLADKGNLPVSLAFDKDAQYQEQRQPHALLLTRAAIYRGKVIGYTRLASPLKSADDAINRLLLGLLFGTTLGAIASAVGIVWLLHQSISPVAEMILRLRQFTADASHELGSPLAVIKSNTDVALKYSDGMRDSDRQKFQSILDAAEQMSRLTEALLNSARMEESAADAGNFEVVDTAALCKKIVLRLAASDEHNTSLTVHTNLSSPLPVAAEVVDLEQLFGNVIGNAFRYTPSGGSITVEGKVDGTRAVVTVSDTGPGIAAADLPRIFDRFWRADKSRNHRSSGTGLGLSIAKAVVEKYHGGIGVESQLGTGTRFAIRLPLAAAAANAGQNASSGDS